MKLNWANDIGEARSETEKDYNRRDLRTLKWCRGSYVKALALTYVYIRRECIG